VPISGLPDIADRLRALDEHGSTLMVEAAAGTGKTSLIAGRITLLLAGGVPPSAIAAITFGELAATGLAERVRRYVADTLAGDPPAVLVDARPAGLAPDEERALRAAAGRLDELTTTTIHGFCQAMIAGYAIEAGIDPGARVMDAEAADTVLEEVFSEWFRDRMSGEAAPGDPIAVLSRDDPGRVVGTLSALTRFRIRHRSARPPPSDLTGRPDLELADAVQGYRQWLSSVELEPATDAMLGQVEELADFYVGSFAEPPRFNDLWRLAHPPRIGCMRWNSRELRPPPTEGAWKKAAGAAGTARHAESLARFEAIDAALRRMFGCIASAVVETLSDELDEVVAAYGSRKRQAALLDFDDLLDLALRMLREHEPVRLALASRYRHVAVDEFQDTDPIQCGILFRLAALHPTDDWRESVPRPGSLFLVGDPKQAIYRFRGADFDTYAAARDCVARAQPDGLLHVTANFRSRPGILGHVNRCFRGPLSRSMRRAYVELGATIGNESHGLPCIARLTVRTPPDAKAYDLREAEAEAVAATCATLLERLLLPDGAATRPLAAGDIALLTPGGSDLWIYERALQRAGLPIVSHAGKGFFRRQETQDLVTLARVLADPGDGLAFGALMRGPLVGLTDEAILDIAMALPPASGPPTRFDLWTAPEHVHDPVAHSVLVTLRGLRRKVWSTTPAQLLSEAVERLDVRAVLWARERHRAAAASANVDAFLERARNYGVRGLVRFAADMTADWRGVASRKEGIADSDRDAIAIVSVHGAKGLEWPVVIPINTASEFRRRERFVHRASDDSLHWLLGDVVPPGLAAVVEEEREAEARERERLWYVACTRAKELLVLPFIPGAAKASWARVVDLAQPDLPELHLAHLAEAPCRGFLEPTNSESAAVFAAGDELITAVSAPLDWLRPSDGDQDRGPAAEPHSGVDGPAVSGAGLVLGPGRVRGLVLHKLLEEMLGHELGQGPEAVERRAAELLRHLLPVPSEASIPPDPAEMAATALAATRLPAVAAIWRDLVPEVTVFGEIIVQGSARPLVGRADAVMLDSEGGIALVVDWKSDVAPEANDIRTHEGQLALYLLVTGAPRGALVYLTPGMVRWVERPNDAGTESGGM
jgi:CRISPR-associated exonuclease Cas4